MTVDFSQRFYYDESSPSGLSYACKTYKYGIGDTAGWVSRGGCKGDYWVVKFQEKHYKAHRVILSLHGMLDETLVTDHIDGNSLNNRIENLRMCTLADNAKNKRIYKSNSSSVNSVNFMQNKSGNTYVHARVYTLDNRRVSKYFSVDKYGIMVAFRNAVIWRSSQVESLNEDGAGYTERHGLQEMFK